MARSRIANRLLAALAAGLIRLLRALPLRGAARFGRAFGMLAYLVDFRHRKVAKVNLTAVFGREKSARQIAAMARENFRRIGENYACGVCTAGMGKDEVSKIIEIEGWEKLKLRPGEKDREKPPNRMLAIGHFGNFEVLALPSHLYPEFRFGTTYRSLSPPELDHVFQSLREESGCIFIERRRAHFAVSRLLREGGVMFGFLSDQSGGPRGVMGPFLGVECSTSPASALYALKHDCPLFTAFCYRTSLARWKIEMGDEIPTRENNVPRQVSDIVRDMNAAFEHAVLRDPANWFWVHNRWKLL